MSSRQETTERRRTSDLRGGAAASLAAAGVCALFLVVSALAQEAQPLSQSPNQSPSQSPSPSQNPNQPAINPPATQVPPAFQPGFIDAVGRWLEQGATRFKSDMQEAQENADKFGSQARDAAKETTGAVIGLPNARVITGRERCIAAPGGGSDCQVAADTVCRGKGFQGGKSLDTQSEQKCPTKLLLEGRAPNDAECPTTIFVTRAMCQ
jgi:hypothetical protein